MPDLDQLLDSDPGAIGRAAAGAAHTPDFETVLLRGRRRRNIRGGTAAGAAALAVGAILGVTQVVGDNDAGPDPAEPPSPTVTVSDPTEPVPGPDAIVDSPDARPVDLAVTPGDPGTMAVVWEVRNKRAVAISDDGFVSRKVFGVPQGSQVFAGPNGAFVIAEGWTRESLRVVDAGRRDEPVTIDGGQGPVGIGEIAVATGQSFAGLRVLGVNTATGTAHPIETPPGLAQFEAHASRFVGLSFGGGNTTYYWSDDGGATWGSAEIAMVPTLAVAVPTAIGQEHAVIESSDGATLLPFVALHTADASTPQDWTSAPSAGDDRLTITSAFVHQGEVRIIGELWNEKGISSTEGIWRVQEGAVEEVESDLPGPRDFPNISLVDLEYLDGPVLWVAVEDGGVYRSGDGGSTWQQYDAR